MQTVHIYVMMLFKVHKMDIYQDIIEELKTKTVTREDVTRIKTRFAKKYRLDRIPTNSEILSHVDGSDLERLLPVLVKKPIRTMSGIAVVAVMARPYPCPGECIYCPGGEDSPRSYTGLEPAALRAKRTGYDPYKQVSDRLKQLESIGHPVDKVELIVMGGTFNAQPADYQEWFITQSLKAMNDFGGAGKLSKTAKSALEPNRTSRLKSDLIDVQNENENARVRNVGITLETRPDFAGQGQIDKMLELGVTRVELGVQTIYDPIYRKVKRGHTIKDVIDATRRLKDSGLKVGYHIMPGLFSNFKTDIKIFDTIFTDENFKPDFIKIYPALVIRGTELFDMWKDGEYSPYSDEEAAALLTEIKKKMPKWTRTMRIQRDIPAKLIEAGVKKGDLGDVVYRQLEENGFRCRCIRCRDAGHLVYKKGIKIGGIEVLKEVYQASGGEEHFISAEDVENDALIAYLRLRFPSEDARRKEIDGKTAIIRELRVVGQMVPIGKEIKKARQHRGLGALLLKEAENVSAINGRDNILITSAIGTREYYRKHGYHAFGPYMRKKL